jgi:hypothetical protein
VIGTLYTPSFAGKILISAALLLTVFLRTQLALAQQGPDYTGEKALVLHDAIYEPQIRTVQFFPNSGKPADVFQFPTVALGSTPILTLQFDDLAAQYSNYYYTIIPCNYNWTRGILQDMELAEDFNEYIIDNYALSVGTRIPYIHYKATMPRLKLSGNYVVVVYRNQNRDDIILSRRFCVYESLVGIDSKVHFAVGAQTRFTHQQVDFQLKIGSYPIVNPVQNVKVTLRQNGRWDNAITGLVPLFVRQEDNTLDYTYFNLENAFMGTNEWRTVDIRSLRNRSFGIERISFTNTSADALGTLEGTRNERNYSQFTDQNGRFAISKTESLEDAQLTADYVNTTFRLAAPRNFPSGSIYVFGQMTDYLLRPAYRLQPDSASEGKILTCTLPLKQGLYSYMFAFVPQGSMSPPDLTPTEGSHSLTENVYDIMVYFRPIGARYDQLAGYSRIQYMGRD